VNQPIDCYAESDILTQLKEIDASSIELALVDSKTWRIRWEDHEKTHTYSNLDWREFPVPYLKLDGNGIPITVHVKAELFQSKLPRKQKGQLTLKMENKKLTCSFKCHNNWNCNQLLKLELLGKEGNATAIVDLETLDEALKIWSGPIWIGMWSDQTHLAIGYGSVNYKKCFII